MSILERDQRCKILDAALGYAANWTVFPTKPDKRGSYKSAARSGGRAWGATSDPDEIRRDFDRWPDAGIGIPTGAGNGIVVVEYDTVIGHGVDGATALEDLQDRHGRLPDTLSAITASGSVHRYLRHPGIKIKCSASELGPGIDVKADGGMVIAPPTAGRRWLNSNPIASMPDWLVELTREPPPKRLSIRERATAAVNAHRLTRMFQSGGAGAYAYAAAALADEINSLANAIAGSRNSALNKSAFSLFQLVHAGLLAAADVERHLVNACIANGLMEDRANGGMKAILATIQSAFNGAAAKPRRGLA